MRWWERGCCYTCATNMQLGLEAVRQESLEENGVAESIYANWIKEEQLGRMFCALWQWGRPKGTVSAQSDVFLPDLTSFHNEGLVQIWCNIAFRYKHNIITWKQGDNFGQDFLTSKMWSQLRNSTVAIFHPGLRWGLFPCHVSQVAERSSLFRVAFLSAMDAFHGGDGITKVMSGLKRKPPT